MIASNKSSAVTPARRQLVELLTNVRFGRVNDLHIRSGQPIFSDPAPRTVRTVKLSGASHVSSQAGDPLSKREIIELFRLLDGVGDGVIGRLEIAHGVPLFAEVHDCAGTSEPRS